MRFCTNPRRAPDKTLGSDWWEGAGALERLREHEIQIHRLQETVAGYENGRFMRLMRWLHQVHAQVRGAR